MPRKNVNEKATELKKEQFKERKACILNAI